MAYDYGLDLDTGNSGKSSGFDLDTDYTDGGSDVFSDNSSDNKDYSDIDLDKDYTDGGSDVFSDNKYDSDNDNDSQDFQNKDSVFTRNSNNKSSSSSSSSDNIDLMKDYTENDYDPVNEKSKEEELKKTINERYSLDDHQFKTFDENNTPVNVENEEVFSDSGYNYIDEAIEDHRMDTPNIEQISEEQRSSTSSTDILNQRGSYYTQEYKKARSYANKVEDKYSKYSGKETMIGSFWNGLKTGVKSGSAEAGFFTAGATALDTAINFMADAFTGDTHKKGWSDVKDQQFDPRFNMTVEEFANVPEGETAYDYDGQGRIDISDDGGSEGSGGSGGSYNFTEDSVKDNDQNNEQNNKKNDQQNSSFISDIGAGLLNLFAQGGGSGSSGSSGSGGSQTVNVVPAGQKEEKEEKEDKKNNNIYYALGLGLLVLGMVYLGGE